MDDRRKGIIAIGIVAGLAAIVATGAYLRTKSGQKFLKDASKRLPSPRGKRK